MSIVRATTRKQYTVIDQQIIMDFSISMEARYLLILLLSFPDDWKVNPKHLAKINDCGRDKIYKLLKILIRRGYAVRKIIRNSAGQIIDSDYVIYEIPITENTEVDESKEPDHNPLSEYPQMDESYDLMDDSPLPKNQAMDVIDDRQTLVTENTEVAPCSDLPDMAQPDTANAEVLTNTKYNLILNLPSDQQVRSEIPRETITVDNTSFTLRENPKKLFQMTIDWYPRDVFLSALRRAGLPLSHPWENDLPEFIMYSIERGQWRTQADWEDKLLQLVIRNKHFQENAAKPIEKGWAPTENVWTGINALGIDVDFARKLIPEFILYWRDTGDQKRSWDETFTEFIKYRWERRSLS